MPRHAYLVVEGQHDVAFVGKFLKAKQLSFKLNKGSLSSFWHKLIPTNFPSNKDGDFHKRVSVPTFYENDQQSVAVHSCDGLSKLPGFLEDSLSTLEELSGLSALGILLDTDKADDPVVRLEKLRREVKKITVPTRLGVVEAIGGIRIGVFSLPNNRDVGTLETVLLECGNAVYPTLFALAQRYISDAKSTPEFRNKLAKRSDEEKALIATMASVLKPGKGNAVSIQDDDWISEKTREVEGVRLFDSFLSDLLEIPLSFPATQV